ncbi:MULTISPECIES: hypothetical protein [Methylobacterium]|uniref:Uncharacterized protein n=1 Tax=Methylobacterium longum TaxID=767694 RepID=A0ABT8AY01_9HYPH|nr:MULTISPECIES: hypothetical protein [Methylobacterium]MCJ2103700.1 hypothetical protein [Methylobacterium sp. E-046]MDN3574291.1 hypothetical protein [Methylobacterium longum]GJE13377.1 hypothetical protein FOHLNKBM_4440 [Methylobacterium longum]
MSVAPDAALRRDAIPDMTRRLDGFARGVGFDEATPRQIVEKVARGARQHREAGP